MLSLLVLPAVIFKLLNVVGKKKLDTQSGAVIGISLLLMFTGVGHFIKTDGMISMIPDFIPARTFIVIATGILELILALALLFRPTRNAAGITVMILLILFLPVNISAAVREVPMGGHAWGSVYLLVRIPLQLFIFAWTYWFAVRIRERRGIPFSRM